MKKTIYSDNDDASMHSHHGFEKKRRRILELCPPPSFFMFNPEDNEQEGKDINLKLDTLNKGQGQDGKACYQYSTNITADSCDTNNSNAKSNENENKEKRDSSLEESNLGKKQICDLDFFKLMSEDDDEDSGESGGLLNVNGGESSNSSNVRYFDMVQHQDSNMNDVTKDISSSYTKAKHERRRSIICPNMSVSDPNITKDSFLKEHQDTPANNQRFSPTAEESFMRSDKVSRKALYKTFLLLHI